MLLIIAPYNLCTILKAFQNSVSENLVFDSHGLLLFYGIEYIKNKLVYGIQYIKNKWPFFGWTIPLNKNNI